MKKNLLVFMLVTQAIGIDVLAQNASPGGGENALGIRAGGAPGVTFKSFAKSGRSAVEFIGGYNFDPEIKNFGLTGLYQVLAPFPSGKLAAQIGAGPTWVFNGNRLGISGNLGFDWRVGRLPVNLSLDWIPTFFFVNSSKFSPVNGAISARYILNNKRINPRPTSAPRN